MDSAYGDQSHVLLTGANGFVGSHILDRILRTTDWIVHCPVSYYHFGSAARIEHVLTTIVNDSVPFSTVMGAEPQPSLLMRDLKARVKIDLCDLSAPISKMQRAQWNDVKYVLNVASNSHVDRSIEEPASFIMNNVQLMCNVLDAAREMDKLEIFLQMSTDEVYGPASEDHAHAEWETVLPSNPYSASKAAQEAIAFAYWRTYEVPVVITNTMNIIGQRQDPEKFLPLVIKRLRSGKQIRVHSSDNGIAGSRFYLHASNLADAWMHIIEVYGLWRVPRFAHGESKPLRLHVVGEREVRNDELVLMIAKAIEAYGAAPWIERKISTDAYVNSVVDYVDFHSSRPGHDLRYALDGALIVDKIGWTPPVTLEASITKTVHWYLRNVEWLY